MNETRRSAGAHRAARPGAESLDIEVEITSRRRPWAEGRALEHGERLRLPLSDAALLVGAGLARGDVR